MHLIVRARLVCIQLEALLISLQHCSSFPAPIKNIFVIFGKCPFIKSFLHNIVSHVLGKCHLVFTYVRDFTFCCQKWRLTLGNCLCSLFWGVSLVCYIVVSPVWYRGSVVFGKAIKYWREVLEDSTKLLSDTHPNKLRVYSTRNTSYLSTTFAPLFTLPTRTHLYFLESVHSSKPFSRISLIMCWESVTSRSPMHVTSPSVVRNDVWLLVTVSVSFFWGSLFCAA